MRRRLTSSRLRAVVSVMPLFMLPLTVAGQTVVDQGSFRLTLGGQEVGSESFSIRQDGTGPSAVTIAQGTVALDTGKVAQEITSWLRISPVGARTAGQ